MKIDGNQFSLRRKVHKDKGLNVKLAKESRFYYADTFDDAGNKIHSICNEFTVKNTNVSFTKNCLIIHTDYGILNIYRIS